MPLIREMNRSKKSRKWKSKINKNSPSTLIVINIDIKGLMSLIQKDLDDNHCYFLHLLIRKIVLSKFKKKSIFNLYLRTNYNT